jgi:hypothetical protein
LFVSRCRDIIESMKAPLEDTSAHHCVFEMISFLGFQHS